MAQSEVQVQLLAKREVVHKRRILEHPPIYQKQWPMVFVAKLMSILAKFQCMSEVQCVTSQGQLLDLVV